MLTGMLAELNNDLDKELEIHKMPMKMKQVTDSVSVDAILGTRTLLDRVAESEGSAGETDVRARG